MTAISNFPSIIRRYNIGLVAAAFVLASVQTAAQEAVQYGSMAGAAALGIRGMAGANQPAIGSAQRTIEQNIPRDGGIIQALSSGTWVGEDSVPIRLNGAEIVNSHNRIPLQVQKGSLIRLDQPAASVFITHPGIADVQIKSPTLIYVFGKAPGETSLFALSADDRILFNGIIKVQHNLGGLNEALARYMPGSNILAHSVQGSIVLSGDVESPVQAEDARRLAASFIGEGGEIVNRLSMTTPNQVNLQVKVAEVSREVIKRLGFRLDASFAGNNSFVGFVSGGGPASFIGDNALLGAVTSGNFSFDGLIDALEGEGLISVLAEPNLTALSGETASFLAGGEFPIPVPQDDDTITITFKKFGVGLAFTPTILSGDRINLKVSPEVSQLTSAGAVSISGFAIPALTTRRAETTVELGSGQSFAIAGLIQNNVIRNLSKVPGLGDIPILGALFRSDEFQREETELVIIITPYIVRPVASPRMALPTDGLSSPTDIERVLRGFSYAPRALSNTPAIRDQAGRRLVGPAGFSIN